MDWVAETKNFQGKKMGKKVWKRGGGFLKHPGWGGGPGAIYHLSPVSSEPGPMNSGTPGPIPPNGGGGDGGGRKKFWVQCFPFPQNSTTYHDLKP